MKIGGVFVIIDITINESGEKFLEIFLQHFKFRSYGVVLWPDNGDVQFHDWYLPSEVTVMSNMTKAMQRLIILHKEWELIAILKIYDFIHYINSWFSKWQLFPF